jgi:hypothetical protein
LAVTAAITGRPNRLRNQHWIDLFGTQLCAVKSPKVIELLQTLPRHIRQLLVLTWDRLPAHRSHLVRDYLDQLGGTIEVEYLPP